MKIRILCVEDNFDNMDILQTILELEAYDVIQARDGEESIRIIQEHLPDLILMDIHLPGESGIVTATRIKSIEELSHIPIIMVTADITKQKESLAIGCAAYLTKPILRGELLSTIRRVLSENDV